MKVASPLSKAFRKGKSIYMENVNSVPYNVIFKLMRKIQEKFI